MGKENPANTAALLTKAESAILVAAERGRVTEKNIDDFGFSREAVATLVSAGLLIFEEQPRVGDPYWIASQAGVACAEFLCPKCNSLMSPGKALIGPPPGITYEGEWPVKFRDCLKCHSCGYSEQIQSKVSSAPAGQ